MLPSARLPLFALVLFLFHSKSTIFSQNTGILITRQPIDQTVCQGFSAANFSVEARSGCESPLEFQWLVSTDGGEDFSAVPTGKQAEFSIPAVVFSIFPDLRLKVKIAATGCEAVESLVVRLVNEGAVKFSASPKKETTIDGGTIQFTARKEAAPDGSNFQFQWQRSRYASGVWDDLAGETDSILTLKNIAPDLNGNLFRAAIRGSGICDRAFSSPTTLFVENAPLVSLWPTEKVVCEHGSASFGVQIQQGTGKERFQWQVSRDEGKNWRDQPGETSRSFSIQDASAELSGSLVRAIVIAPGGRDFQTGVARLQVSGTVSIAQQPANFLACMGDSAIFQVKARATGQAASYQWQQSPDGKNWLNLPGKTAEMVSIFVEKEEMNGWQFRALVTAGQCQEIASEAARLDVVQSISFAQNGQFTFVEGRPVELKTEPSKSPGIFIGQWQFSSDGGQAWSGLKDASSPVLQIPLATAAMDGRLFRYKMFSKECGRIHFSEPILVRVSSGN